jgi:hypothetical protein
MKQLFIHMFLPSLVSEVELYFCQELNPANQPVGCSLLTDVCLFAALYISEFVGTGV